MDFPIAADRQPWNRLYGPFQTMKCKENSVFSYVSPAYWYFILCIVTQQSRIETLPFSSTLCPSLVVHMSCMSVLMLTMQFMLAYNTHAECILLLWTFQNAFGNYFSFLIRFLLSLVCVYSSIFFLMSWFFSLVGWMYFTSSTLQISTFVGYGWSFCWIWMSFLAL